LEDEVVPQEGFEPQTPSLRMMWLSPTQNDKSRPDPTKHLTFCCIERTQ
jgi:hypothetical protein